MCHPFSSAETRWNPVSLGACGEESGDHLRVHLILMAPPTKKMLLVSLYWIHFAFFKLNVKQESDQQANRFGILFEDVDSNLNVISVPKNTIIFVNKKVLVETLQ